MHSACAAQSFEKLDARIAASEGPDGQQRASTLMGSKDKLVGQINVYQEVFRLFDSHEPESTLGDSCN